MKRLLRKVRTQPETERVCAEGESWRMSRMACCGMIRDGDGFALAKVRNLRQLWNGANNNCFRPQIEQNFYGNPRKLRKQFVAQNVSCAYLCSRFC
jgi:hypothetical protein